MSTEKGEEWSEAFEQAKRKVDEARTKSQETGKKLSRTDYVNLFGTFYVLSSKATAAAEESLDTDIEKAEEIIGNTIDVLKAPQEFLKGSALNEAQLTQSVFERSIENLMKNVALQKIDVET